MGWQEIKKGGRDNEVGGVCLQLTLSVLEMASGYVERLWDSLGRTELKKQFQKSSAEVKILMKLSKEERKQGRGEGVGEHLALCLTSWASVPH